MLLEDIYQFFYAASSPQLQFVLLIKPVLASVSEKVLKIQ